MIIDISYLISNCGLQKIKIKMKKEEDHKYLIAHKFRRIKMFPKMFTIQKGFQNKFMTQKKLNFHTSNFLKK